MENHKLSNYLDPAVRQVPSGDHEQRDCTHHRALLELRRMVYGDALDRWANEGGAIDRRCHLIGSACEYCCRP